MVLDSIKTSKMKGIPFLRVNQKP